MSEEPCTDCGDTGITYQTERRCACQPEPTRTAANVEAEPVAWMYERPDGLAYALRHRLPADTLVADTTVTPLYPASALEQVRKDALPDEIEIYRVLKASPSRKLGDLARAVYAAFNLKDQTNG